ncbi:NUDIX hydrolase [Massilia sp. 9096]|uniref:NUDIX hydrolase n=1 Tax=Massilia sp. 9096 TaxID=1500894 RepID=UPI0005678975|nr:NUDIX hydrolase [Massilia sp. 9096]
MEEAWTYHPQLDEHGRKHRIHAPSCEANLANLADAQAGLTFIPGSTCARMLNGVELTRCTQSEIDHALKQASTGPSVAAPPHLAPAGMRAAAGAVVLEPDGRIWLVAPSNGFGGYQATFPKGRVEPGASLQATAIKEIWEESGLLVALTAYLGDFSRTQTFTRFYLARRVGGHPADMGWESQAVHLVTPARARQLLNRETDHAVLDAVAVFMAR